MPNSLHQFGPHVHRPPHLRAARGRSDDRSAFSCGVAVCGGNRSGRPPLVATQCCAHRVGAHRCRVWVGGAARATHGLAAAGRVVAAARRMVRRNGAPPCRLHPRWPRFLTGCYAPSREPSIGTGPVRTELEQNVDEPSAASPSERVDLRVASVEVVNDESDAQALVGGGVRLTVRWPAGSGVQAFACGDRVRAVVRLLPPETLSRSRSLEPRGFPAGRGHYLDGDGGCRSCRPAGPFAWRFRVVPRERMATRVHRAAAGVACRDAELAPRPCASLKMMP